MLPHLVRQQDSLSFRGRGGEKVQGCGIAEAMGIGLCGSRGSSGPVERPLGSPSWWPILLGVAVVRCGPEIPVASWAWQVGELRVFWFNSVRLSATGCGPCPLCQVSAAHFSVPAASMR